ncbi:hypothetical protein HZS_4521 [Henneguya salminicola]|nr:hypothetical protein HZS_4521 [Henneguya salminicola]
MIHFYIATLADFTSNCDAIDVSRAIEEIERNKDYKIANLLRLACEINKALKLKSKIIIDEIDVPQSLKDESKRIVDDLHIDYAAPTNSNFPPLALLQKALSKAENNPHISRFYNDPHAEAIVLCYITKFLKERAERDTKEITIAREKTQTENVETRKEIHTRDSFKSLYKSILIIAFVGFGIVLMTVLILIIIA